MGVSWFGLVCVDAILLGIVPDFMNTHNNIFILPNRGDHVVKKGLDNLSKESSKKSRQFVAFFLPVQCVQLPTRVGQRFPIVVLQENSAKSASEGDQAVGYD